MNCRPNELAVAVSVGANVTGLAREICIAVLGIPVRVTHLRPPNNPACRDPLVWNFEEPVVVKVGNVRFQVTGCSDAHMKPLRNPGVDARDETLGWPHPMPVAGVPA